MKWLLTLCLLAGVASADKPVRKTEPKTDDKFLKAAGEAFAKARAADDAGKLAEALRYYEKANAISPHPSTTYNIADVLRRDKRIKQAVVAYRKYLELAPDAADRAKVEKLIGELEAMPGTLEIEIEESDAQIFIDGQPAKGMKHELPAGDHVVDVITPISAASEDCQVYAGSKRTCRIRLKPRVDGNVFLTGPRHVYRASVSTNGFRYQIKTRFQLEPKRYEFELSRFARKQCAPLAFDVAAGDVVTYVWIEAPKDTPKRGECATVTAKQRTLKL